MQRKNVMFTDESGSKFIRVDPRDAGRIAFHGEGSGDLTAFFKPGKTLLMKGGLDAIEEALLKVEEVKEGETEGDDLAFFLNDFFNVNEHEFNECYFVEYDSVEDVSGRRKRPLRYLKVHPSYDDHQLGYEIEYYNVDGLDLAKSDKAFMFRLYRMAMGDLLTVKPGVAEIFKLLKECKTPNLSEEESQSLRSQLEKLNLNEIDPANAMGLNEVDVDVAMERFQETRRLYRRDFLKIKEVEQKQAEPSKTIEDAQNEQEKGQETVDTKPEASQGIPNIGGGVFSPQSISPKAKKKRAKRKISQGEEKPVEEEIGPIELKFTVKLEQNGTNQFYHINIPDKFAFTLLNKEGKFYFYDEDKGKDKEDPNAKVKITKPKSRTFIFDLTKKQLEERGEFIQTFCNQVDATAIADLFKEKPAKKQSETAGFFHPLKLKFKKPISFLDSIKGKTDEPDALDEEAQAIRLLDEIDLLCSVHGVPEVGLPFSANHAKQTLHVHDVYRNDQWETGIHGHGQAAVIANIEKLLKSPKYQHLQFRVKFLPVTTCEFPGGKGKTREEWVQDDLHRIEEFIENGGTVIGWQNQDTGAGYAIGGGVAGDLPPSIKDLVQKTFARFATKYPDETIKVAKTYDYLEELFLALEDARRLHTWPLDCEEWYKKIPGFKIDRDKLFKAFTKEQKQLLIIEMILRYQFGENYPNELVIPELSDSDLNNKVTQLIEQISLFRSTSVHHIKLGAEERFISIHQNSTDPKQEEFYSITGTTGDKAETVNSSNAVYYQPNPSAGLSDGIIVGISDGDPNMAQFILQTAANEIHKYDTPEDFKNALYSSQEDFIKSLDRLAIEKNKQWTVSGDGEPARAALSIGRAYRTSTGSTFVGLSHGRTMFVAINTKEKTIRTLAAAKETNDQLTDGFPMMSTDRGTRYTMIDENLNPDEYVVGLTDGIFNLLPLSERDAAENIQLDCEAVAKLFIDASSDIGVFVNALKGEAKRKSKVAIGLNTVTPDSPTVGGNATIVAATMPLKPIFTFSASTPQPTLQDIKEEVIPFLGEGVNPDKEGEPEIKLESTFAKTAAMYAQRLSDYASARKKAKGSIQQQMSMLGKSSLQGYDDRIRAAEALSDRLSSYTSIDEFKEVVELTKQYRQRLRGTHSDLLNIFSAMEYDAKLSVSISEEELLGDAPELDLKDVSQKILSEKVKLELTEKSVALQLLLADYTKDDSIKLKQFKEYLQYLLRVVGCDPNDISVQRIKNIEASNLGEFYRILRRENTASKNENLRGVLHNCITHARATRIPGYIHSDLREFTTPCAQALLKYADAHERRNMYRLKKFTGSSSLQGEAGLEARMKTAGELAHKLLKCTTQKQLEEVTKEALLFKSKLVMYGEKNSKLVGKIEKLQGHVDSFISDHGNQLPSGEPSEMDKIWEEGFKRDTVISKKQRCLPASQSNIDVIFDEETREKWGNYLNQIKQIYNEMANVNNSANRSLNVDYAVQLGKIGSRLAELLKSYEVKEKKKVSEMSLEQFVGLMMKTTVPYICSEQMTTKKKIENGEWTENECQLLGNVVRKVANVKVYTKNTLYTPENPITENDIIESDHPTCDMLFMDGALINDTNPIDRHLIIDKRGEIVEEKYKKLLLQRILPGLIDASRSHPEGTIITIPRLGGGEFAGRSYKADIERLFPMLLKQIVQENLHVLANIKAIVYTDGPDKTEDKVEHLNSDSSSIPFITTNRKIGFCPQRDDKIFTQLDKKLQRDLQKCAVTAIIAGDRLSYPGNDAYLGSPRTYEGAAGAYTNLIEKITRLPGKLERYIVTKTGKLARVMFELKQHLAPDEDKKFPSDICVEKGITLNVGEVVTMCKANSNLYNMGKAIQQTADVPIDPAVQETRQCAIAAALSCSNNIANRTLGHQLIEKITPERIEANRRDFPVPYYAQFFLACLADLRINRDDSVEAKKHLQETVQGYVDNLLIDPKSVNLDTFRDVIANELHKIRQSEENRQSVKKNGFGWGMFVDNGKESNKSGLEVFLTHFLNAIPVGFPKLSELKKQKQGEPIFIRTGIAVK